MKNKYIKFIFFCLLFVITKYKANAQAFAWAKQAGSASVLDEGTAVGLDGSGNVYTVGTFGDSADFDPGPGVFKLYSAGAEDIYIQKLDASGNFIWAKSIGSTTLDKVWDIHVATNGTFLIAGSFTGTADFDPSAGTSNLVTTGSDDIFFAKYDANGTLLFAKKAGGTAGDAARGIAVMSDGSILLTGYFRSIADFDPGVTTANLTSNGSGDVFVAKYDSLGGYVWANGMGGSNGDIGHGITFDNSGNIIVAGDFYGTAVDFDPGVGSVTLSTNGFSDVFVAKYTSGGALVWARSAGSIVNDVAFGVAVDVSGNVYATGYFQSIVDFDPGPGTANFTAAGEDIFILKLSAVGDYIWNKQIGGVNPDQALDINIDNLNNFYITGFFTSVVDFDPGAGLANLTGLGTQDVFVAKYDSLGSYVWAKGFGGTGFEQGNDIAISPNAEVYTTGYFNGTVDFDPGIGVTSLISLGSKDAFTEKMTAPAGYVTSLQSQEVSVYPNPVYDILTIRLGERTANSSVVVTDMLGNKVMERQFNNQQYLKLSVADIPPGNYIIMINTDNTKSTASFVKQ